jgi:hypothetical protein
LLSYERLFKKPILFKSFTAGLTVQEFDEIYDKEIAKNIPNMRYNAYPKEKAEKETLVLLEDLSNLTQRIGFLCLWCTIICT